MKKFTILAILFFVLLANPVWAIGDDTGSVPQMPKPDPSLQTDRGTERPYQVGGSYETQTARPIIVYRTNTHDYWARGQVEKLEKKLTERDQAWRKEIHANRLSLTTAKQERVKICKDISSLNESVTGLIGRIDSLEKGEKTTNENFEILNRKEKINFQYTIAAFIIGCATLGGFIYLFYCKFKGG